MQVLVAIYSPSEVWTIPASQVDVLRRRFPEVVFLHAQTDADVIRLIPEADVAFTSVLTPQAFAVAHRLRWVHSSAAGVGSMLFPAMLASKVVMTNSRGMSAASVAEHTIALILAALRRIPETIRAQDGRRWIQTELSGLPTLDGQTLGIVGLGAIGCRVARIGAAIGMKVIGTRRETDWPVPDGVAEALAPSDLSRLLEQSDVVVLSAPLTAETRGLIGAPELAQMKRTAWLVNVARGKLVQEAALIEALRSGTIAGAALDVFEHEPLGPASSLWAMPNVLVTPHVAGFCGDYWEAATDLFSDNLRRFLAGQPLVNLVDKGAGY
ncbi:MAG: D-2-hydroxyacid dehydrogenase [Acidobacteria bacterium]|nr:D-2-hydroxyacid dehydrogenase [Acidobacteriota bacterium]